MLVLSYKLLRLGWLNGPCNMKVQLIYGNLAPAADNDKEDIFMPSSKIELMKNANEIKECLGALE